MAFGTTVMEIAQWVHLEESIQLYETDPECIYLHTLLINNLQKGDVGAK